MKFILGLSALATLAASPALAATTPAQTSATAEAYGVVLQPLTLTKVSDLNFGTVIASATAGTVTIDATSGGRAVSGGVTAVPNYPGNRGEFQGAGQVGQVVQIGLSPLTQLISTTNPTDTLTVTSLSLDKAGATRTIDSTQAFTVGVGGDFAIAANQPNGLYSASFDVTADYQ